MKFLKWCELWTVSVCFHSWYKDCFFRNFFFWIFLTDAGGCTGQAEAAGNRLLLPVWKWISQFNQVHILIFLLFSQTNLLIGISDLSNVDGWPSFCFHTATLMGVLGGYWYWKVVLEFWFGHLKCHFWYPQNSQKHPKWSISGVLGGTKNGTLGARIKILRPLFDRNTP